MSVVQTELEIACCLSQPNWYLACLAEPEIQATPNRSAVCHPFKRGGSASERGGVLAKWRRPSERAVPSWVVLQGLEG